MTEARVPVAIKIVAAPIGEAPLWVREAWIGLTLPLSHPTRSRQYPVIGVLTGPRTFLGQCWAILRGKVDRIESYPVFSAEAVSLLGQSQPEAAAWWRSEVTRCTLPGRKFLFDAPACKPVYQD